MKRILPYVFAMMLCSAASYAQEVQYLTTQEFKDKVFDYTKDSVWTYKGSVPCIVDFYATWCGPCRRLAPVMEELAKVYKGKVLFYKADTDKERELAYYFHITSIPTLLFVPVGKLPQMSKGAPPREALEDAIDKLLIDE